MTLELNVTFNAILSRAEQAILADLPDWPTVEKVTHEDRVAINRLQRLGCIEIERCKDDPIQVWFDFYAGRTFVGRGSAASGIVRIAPSVQP